MKSAFRQMSTWEEDWEVRVPIRDKRVCSPYEAWCLLIYEAFFRDLQVVFFFPLARLKIHFWKNCKLPSLSYTLPAGRWWNPSNFGVSIKTVLWPCNYFCFCSTFFDGLSRLERKIMDWSSFAKVRSSSSFMENPWVSLWIGISWSFQWVDLPKKVYVTFLTILSLVMML